MSLPKEFNVDITILIYKTNKIKPIEATKDYLWTNP